MKKFFVMLLSILFLSSLAFILLLQNRLENIQNSFNLTVNKPLEKNRELTTEKVYTDFTDLDEKLSEHDPQNNESSIKHINNNSIATTEIIGVILDNIESIKIENVEISTNYKNINTRFDIYDEKDIIELKNHTNLNKKKSYPKNFLFGRSQSDKIILQYENTTIEPEKYTEKNIKNKNITKSQVLFEKEQALEEHFFHNIDINTIADDNFITTMNRDFLTTVDNEITTNVNENLMTTTDNLFTLIANEDSKPTTNSILNTITNDNHMITTNNDFHIATNEDLIATTKSEITTITNDNIVITSKNIIKTIAEDDSTTLALDDYTSIAEDDFLATASNSFTTFMDNELESTENNLVESINPTEINKKIKERLTSVVIDTTVRYFVDENTSIQSNISEYYENNPDTSTKISDLENKNSNLLVSPLFKQEKVVYKHLTICNYDPINIMIECEYKNKYSMKICKNTILERIEYSKQIINALNIFIYTKDNSNKKLLHRYYTDQNFDIYYAKYLSLDYSMTRFFEQLIVFVNDIDYKKEDFKNPSEFVKTYLKRYLKSNHLSNVNYFVDTENSIKNIGYIDQIFESARNYNFTLKLVAEFELKNETLGMNFMLYRQLDCKDSKL